MGIINSVRCKNKSCGYYAEIKEGSGFALFAREKEIEEKIKNGTIENIEALKCINNGAEICSVSAYLCPMCKEFVTDNQIFFRTNITVSPYGTVRYKTVFPFGLPKCKKCNTELIYIDNIRSSKVKCPKCGGELKAKLVGYYD